MQTSEAFSLFLAHSRRRRLAQATLSRYAYVLDQFRLLAPSDLAAVSESTLERYIDAHETITPRTLRHHLIIIRACLRWCFHRHYIEHDPISPDFALPTFRPIIRPSLSIDELKNLLEYCPQRDYYCMRARTMWTIIALTGIRLSECRTIKLGDVTENGLIVKGKGDKSRVVPLPPRARAAINEYLPFLHWTLHHKPEKVDWLFPGHWSSQPMSKVSVDRIFRQTMRGLGLSGYSVHCLRHTYATLLVRQGVSLAILQQLLGHASINSTMVYLHVSAADTTTAAFKHPLANV